MATPDPRPDPRPDSRLDPEIARFIALVSAGWQRHPPLAAMPIAQARAVAEEVRAPWTAGGPAMAETREAIAALPGGDLRIRLYRPCGVAPEDAPAVVYLHGGGFVYFSLDTHDRLMREYAAAGGFVVIGVDYPLAPEARYPVALDLLVALLRWLGPNRATLGIDPARVAIGGDSAGANLALAACLRLRDAAEGFRVRALLSNYGAFSSAVSEAAEAAYGGPAAMLTQADMAFYFAQYLRDHTDADSPFACPLTAHDLSRLPPTLFVIPEFDVLREQSEAVARTMTAAGTQATSILYRGTTHSFLEAMSIAGVARTAIGDGAQWLASHLA